MLTKVDLTQDWQKVDKQLFLIQIKIKGAQAMEGVL